LKHHPTDELDIDFLYIQGARYLLTKSKSIKFQSIQSFNRISKRNKSTGRITYKRGPKAIIAGLKKVLDAYTACGFEIMAINGDNEFTKIVGKVGPPCAANEHIDMIERSIRTLKEHMHCTWNPLPYRKTPKIAVNKCVYDITSIQNDFLHKYGISHDISPAAIVLARPKLNCSNRKISFGACCEVYAGTKNDGTPRSISSIAL
jgi:hypothetical protein